MLHDLRFDEILGDVLKRLAENRVAEGTGIEYKRELPGGKDHDKKEFLADICSFANAIGGDLLYGVEEKAGLPIAFPGIGVTDVDQEISRLESLCRDGIQPPVQGIKIKTVSVDGGTVLVVRIPPSWGGPHMVTYQKNNRFYLRNSNGKYLMDVNEIRDAFLTSQTRIDAIKGFRSERLDMIRRGEAPVPLSLGPKTVLHLTPLLGPGTSRRLDLSLLEGHEIVAVSGSPRRRYNLDGYLCYDTDSERNALSYVQVFRDGAIESLDALAIDLERKLIPSLSFEQHVIKAFTILLGVARILEVSSPLAVQLSLLGVRGFRMGLRQHDFVDLAVDRDELLIPEFLINSTEGEPAVIIRPALDMVWNACGFKESRNYDADGNWHPRS